MIRNDADAAVVDDLRARHDHAVQQRDQLRAQWSYGPGHWDAVSAAETEVDATRQALEAAVDLSALRVHGTICPTGAGVLACPACADRVGFLLLASHDRAVAVCRCGAVCRHHMLTTEVVTSHFDDARRIATPPARAGASWVDVAGDVFTDHPHAADVAVDIDAAWAHAQDAELDHELSHE